MKTKIQIIVIVASVLMFAGCSSMKPVTTAEPTSFQPQKNSKQASYYNTEMGVTYLERGQIPLAKQKIMLAIQQDPKSIVALDAMGYYHEVTGNNKLANEYYLKAIKVNPKSGRALNNYGAFLCRTGNYKYAEGYFRDAFQDPSYVNTASAYENAGLCEIGIPNYVKAEYYFKRALMQDPKRATSLYELAKLNYKQKKYSAAQKYLTDLTALQTKPSASTLWLGIQIAKASGDENTLLQDGLKLTKNFPKSKQAKLYQKMQSL